MRQFATSGMDRKEIYIKDYNYPLPSHLIAEFPLPERDQSKLLIYKDGIITDDSFVNVDAFLPASTSLILNNTSVIEVRILFQKQTGGIIEIFCLEPVEQESIGSSINQNKTVQLKCLIGGASKWKQGQLLKKEFNIDNKPAKLTAQYIGKETDSFIIQFSWQPETLSFAEILHSVGAIPLPPYIKRKAIEADAERYQTVFATQKGSVAAPTAALHFTEKVLDRLKQKEISVSYVTLHVGAGTFKPVKSETIAEHKMHAEEFHVTFDSLQQLLSAKEIIAVGTTSLRTLESLYWLGIKCNAKLFNNKNELSLGQWEAYELESGMSYSESLKTLIDYMQATGIETLFCKTSLLIVPGYKFKSARALITNFHQPQSTLLLLVSAFIGDDWKKVYDHALENNYRFLSYGDSSLLFRKD